MVAVQQRAGQYGKGNIDLFALAADSFGLILGIGVVEPHGHMAAFACQCIGGDGLAVQRIGDSHGDGQRIVGGTLPAVVTLDILRIGQGGLCLFGGLGVAAVVLLADDDFFSAAVGTGDHIYRLAAADDGSRGFSVGLIRGGSRFGLAGLLVSRGKGGDTGQRAHQSHRQYDGNDLFAFHKLTSCCFV